MGCLGLRSSERPVRATEVDIARATSVGPMSLFVVAILDDRERWRGRPILDERPFLETAGFARTWSDALKGRPKRFGRLDSHTIDKFVSLESGSTTRGLAEVRIVEALAYDLPYRSEIGATGTSIRIVLRPGAVKPIVEFVEARARSLPPWTQCWSGCVFRFPVRRTFSFPEPRGSDDPYGGGEGPGGLRDIATVRVDALEMAVVSHPRSPAVNWDTQPLSALVAGPEILGLSW